MFIFVFFNDTTTTEIYTYRHTLSLHDALPIYRIVHEAARGLAAGRCSTGEQKALLVSIVLAHARLIAEARGAPPLLLLDEVAAHLDAARRDALFDAV